VPSQPPNNSTDSRRTWDRVAQAARPSWYLDPLVARQKRDVHQELVRRWTAGETVQRVLKTDVFEEAHGEDQFFLDLFPDKPVLMIGMDAARLNAVRAGARSTDPRYAFFCGDVRAIGLASGSIGLVVSNSTLDHFNSPKEIVEALLEIRRVLAPGGLLIITLDNPRNPLYPLLRWLSRRQSAPFHLGPTWGRADLNRRLKQMGFEVTGNDWLIHNPRIVSTAFFLALRRLLGHRADRAIAWSLRAFATLGRLPTRSLTACFVAARARKSL
jgi:SAM-dependent methyltransferase